MFLAVSAKDRGGIIAALWSVELTWQVESCHECTMLACRLQTAVAASAGVPISSVIIFSAASSGSNFLVGLQVICTNHILSRTC